jgi:hypothetical protein
MNATWTKKETYLTTCPCLVRYSVYICHNISRFTAMTQTADSKKHPVRGEVDAATKEAMKDEQDRLRKQLGRRPSLNEVVAIWLTERAKQPAEA